MNKSNRAVDARASSAVAPMACALLSVALPIAACGGGDPAVADLQLPRSRSAALLQTCTAQDARGFPLAGTVCGGIPDANGCEPGALYVCQPGPRGALDNCTLVTACAIGCETNPPDAKGILSDVCYGGPAPLAVTPSSTAGGNEVTATVTLTEPHPNGVVDNIKINRGDLIAAQPFCNVLDVPANGNSVEFNMPTAVVSATTPVAAHAVLSFTTASGFSRFVVSRSTTVTLQPGGTAPPLAPLASFTLSPSTIAPAGASTMNATLTHMAPAEALPAPQGTLIHVTSSDPAIASVIANAQPIIQPGCMTGGGAQTIRAANSVPQQSVVKISATSGDAANTVVTSPVTVTAGCTPKSCVDLPAGQCSAPDACGGTLACGCPGGQVCGASGICQSAPATPGVSTLALNPSTVTGSSPSTATVGP